MFSKLFTWWNGATIGTLFTIAKHGRFVVRTEQGNRYYEAKTDKGSYDVGRKRQADPTTVTPSASKVSPDWHGWLHWRNLRRTAHGRAVAAADLEKTISPI